MAIQGYQYARPMEESESCLAAVVRAGLGDEMAIASQIMEQPTAYRVWESEHNEFLQGVSKHFRLAPQMGALRSAAFALIHRQALFEYIRDRSISGDKRHRLFSLFYSNRDFANAVVSEHASFLRCSSSRICLDHLAEHLMRDAAFAEPMQFCWRVVHRLFRVFCDVALAESEDEKVMLAPTESLKPLLKSALARGAGCDSGPCRRCRMFVQARLRFVALRVRRRSCAGCRWSKVWMRITWEWMPPGSGGRPGLK